VNTDKAYYDSSVNNLTDLTFVDGISIYVNDWIDNSKIFHSDNLRVLELGAGSCTTGCLLSRKKAVKSVVESDISAWKMEQIAPMVCRRVGGDFSKLSFVESDFNDPLPFGNEEFDIVVMDAALHHSRNIWLTLSEIRRVLKKNGTFVAQREAYTSPMTHNITFNRLLESPEFAAQVSENAYLKSQYSYYLKANGFLPEFVSVFENWKFRIFWFLNGIFFSKYNIYCKRK
jgi:ubiquinone/menaquinone biosynthesis C-methylase UbiE